MQIADHDFWRGRWLRGETGWHQDEAHPWLVDAPGFWRGRRVLVPLCGRSPDLDWLRAHAGGVVGVEFVREAVEGFFADRDWPVTTRQLGAFEVWTAVDDGPPFSILCGDIFDLDATVTGPVDALWDRAALVALPRPQRAAYVARLAGTLAPAFVGRLVSFDSPDAADEAGPPFAVAASEIEALWGHAGTALTVHGRAASDTPRIELYCELRRG